jgi:hypothetical protein
LGTLLGTPSSIPAFFVPECTESEAEQTYQAFAALCQLPVPPLHERVYSIVFKHDGVEWTATVGKKHRGYSTITSGKYKGREQRQEDDSIVLAIFPDPSCYRVVIERSGGSDLANPYLAGMPQRVTGFSA